SPPLPPFLFYRPPLPRYLHPFPTRRSSDLLLEAMDFPGLKRVLEGMDAGRFTLVARDTPEPSPLSHEVLNAKPYAFLDDAPLERSEEHTSELQSPDHLVCRLLLEKKNKENQ